MSRLLTFQYASRPNIKEIENNANAKFWRDKKEYYSIF